MTNKPLREIFASNVIGVSPGTFLSDVVRLMRSKNISCVVVLDDGMPVGIFTERNLLWTAAHRDQDFDATPIRKLMSSPVVTVSHDMGVHDAYLTITARRLRHLVVVDGDGRAVRVLTQSDMVEHVGEDYLAEIRKVSSLMRGGPVTGSRTDSVRKAVELMAEKSISCLVVVEGDYPVGILTERDLVRLLTERRGLDNLTLEDVMSAPVHSVRQDMPAFEVAQYLLDKPFRRVVVVDEAGRVLGVVTQTDIVRSLESRYVETLHRRLDEKRGAIRILDRDLHEKTLYLDNILRFSMDQGIVATDHAFRVTYFNPMAERIFGLDADEVLGRDVRELHVENGVELNRFNTAIAAAAKQSRYDFEFRLGAEGERTIIKAGVSGIRDEERNSCGYLLVLRDITERRRAQERLADVNHHLEELVKVRTRDLSKKAAELELANHRLTGLDEMKSTFLSSVSHELRTPLTSLLGFVKLIKRDFGKLFAPLAQGDATLERKSARVGDNLDIVVREGERLTRLINDFLDLSKIEAGQIEWHDKEVTVAELVEHAVSAVSGQFAQRACVDLIAQVDDDLPVMTFDLDRMMQVMINLLNNAAKFTREGTVTVTARMAGDSHAEVRVADTGSGIPKEECERVFSKYQQYSGADTVVRKKGGTGLGLAICKEIVSHYGGSIWVESELGKGSTFIFQLPVQGRASDAACSPDAQRDALAESAKPLVLVVDGDRETCSCLETKLVGEGLRVIFAHDAQTALERAREALPDLVCMELYAPGLNGGEAVRRFRHDTITSHIPIIITSAFPGPDGGKRPGRPSEPVDMEQFLVTVRGLLHGEVIRGRKCMLLNAPKCEVTEDMMVICSGKINYMQPDQVFDRVSSRFEGTIFIPSGGNSANELEKLSHMEDILVVVMPDSE